jgi:hypothetical protein
MQGASLRVRLKKTWLAVLLLPVLASILPADALSALPPIDVRDPYIRRFISLTLSYELDSIETTDNQSGESQSSERFLQTYDVSLVGNVVDPRLFVYSAGLTFTDATSSGTNISESQYNSLALSFQTILLRQLKFPLTFSYKRIMTESDPGGKSASERYGLHWLLKLSKLPQTTLIAERNVDYPEDGDAIVSSYYQIMMSKKLWNTDNHFSHSMSFSENSESMTTIYSNHAHLSRYTDMHTAAQRSQTTTDTVEGSGDSNSLGISMSLSSSPSRYFNQSHGFTSYESESDTSESTGQFFSGRFLFRPKSTLTATLNMTASKQETNMTIIDETTLLPVTNDFASESLSSAASVSYEITPRLSWTNEASYRLDSNETSGVETNATETEVMGVNSALQYGRDLGWASLSAGYGFGYMQETVKPQGKGSMLANSATLGLGGMNLRLFSFSTSAAYNRNDNLTGNTWSNSRTLTASVSNRFWQRFAAMSASYGNTLTESWRKEDTSETNNYALSATNTYFKKVAFGATYAMSDITTFEQGNTVATHATLFASHGRPLLGGSLSLKGSYGIHTREDELPGGDTDYTSLAFDAVYKRILLGRIGWVSAFSASKYEDRANSRFAQRASLVNNFGYQLRAWSLTLSHKYLLLQGDFEGDFTESEILFKASRSFGWFI